jgi:hypothetical protein
MLWRDSLQFHLRRATISREFISQYLLIELQPAPAYRAMGLERLDVLELSVFGYPLRVLSVTDATMPKKLIIANCILSKISLL